MEANLSEEVGDLLRCPETRQPLRFATAKELETIGFSSPEGGFLTEDGAHAYPVMDGFPMLKVEDRIVRSEGQEP